MLCKLFSSIKIKTTLGDNVKRINNQKRKNMKAFKDLEFKTHIYYPHFDKHARMDFDNGYGISVINGNHAYCGVDTFEVAVFKDGELCYDTHITDDTIGYCTEDDVTRIMKKIQEL